MITVWYVLVVTVVVGMLVKPELSVMGIIAVQAQIVDQAEVVQAITVVPVRIVVQEVNAAEVIAV